MNITPSNQICPKCGSKQIKNEDYLQFLHCISCENIFVPEKIISETTTQPKPHQANASLFITGFLQVLFIAINTYFLSKEFYVGVLVCGFAISLIWSYNVKKVAFGSLNDRLIYATGAGFGSLVGLMVSVYILKGLFNY